jgi:ArsR family transcriptional regulator
MNTKTLPPTATGVTIAPAPATLTEEQIVRALGALAQATRLRLFRALVVAGPDGLAAGALSGALEIAPSALSFHLKELTHAGLIEARQDGRFMIYKARFDEMIALVAFLTENCCQGDGAACCR